MTEEILKEDNIQEEAVESTAEEASASEAEVLNKQIEDLKEKNLRLMAEFENYKRRTQKEKDAAFEYATANTAASMLPILDTLELSLSQEIKDAEKFKTGVELVVKQFADTLEKLNIKEIENKIFDPELHNAVMRDEESEAESGAIVEVFQKGYKISDRVIRHSMVKVKG